MRDTSTCHVVTVGGRTYRYALLRATPATAATVVVDPGGPGATPLAHEGVQAYAQSHAGPLAATRNVLMLEEPWVTAPEIPGCGQATTEFSRALRAARPSGEAGLRVQRDCRLGAAGTYGFSAYSYPALLRQIAQREGVEYEGFVGASFGAARLGYARDAGLIFRWAILLRPYPLAASPRDLATARAAAVDAAFPTSALPVAPGAPMSPADAVAARIGSGRLGTLPATPAEVVERARGVWQIYGTERISLSLLAYFDEVCRLGPLDKAEWNGTARDVRGFLASFHAPCRGMDATVAPAPPTLRQPRLCVVSSDADTITPGALVRASFRAQAAQWVESRVAAHASTDGIARCQAYVGGG